MNGTLVIPDASPFGVVDRMTQIRAQLVKELSEIEQREWGEDDAGKPGAFVHWGACRCCGAFAWWVAWKDSSQACTATRHDCGAGITGLVEHIGQFEPTPEEWAVLMPEKETP